MSVATGAALAAVVRRQQATRPTLPDRARGLRVAMLTARVLLGGAVSARGIEAEWGVAHSTADGDLAMLRRVLATLGPAADVSDEAGVVSVVVHGQCSTCPLVVGTDPAGG